MSVPIQSMAQTGSKTRKRRTHTMRVVKPDGPVQPGNRRDLTHLMHETANNHKQGLEAYTRASSTW